MERCAYWAPCFWLISPKWLTFQAKDMHIRELNNKVLGKKEGHFSRGRPFKCGAKEITWCAKENIELALQKLPHSF